MATLLKRHFKDHIRTSKPAVDGRCKKHPKHRQSPGVCSLCLRERLSQLMTNPTRQRLTSATTDVSDSSTLSSLSSYYSSSCGSSCSSPMQHYRYRYRERIKGGFISGFLLGNGNNVLKKSRSLAFAIPRSIRGDNNCDVRDDDRKRKTGFWSKLLNQGNSKRTAQETSFMHSRTVRERVH